ncbi:MAG: hypothetical protein INQ03_09860 [Candidatus Heimdallarchaeota archaeon]|nr:hypothetical protein [Candidatus Heimdallarchaeota archaeon]
MKFDEGMTSVVTKVLCLGDSLTTGYPEYTIYGKEEAVYKYWLERMTSDWLAQHNIDMNIEFINAGVPGDTIPRMQKRLYNYADYDVVIIIGGTNDVAMGKSPESILINFEQLIHEFDDNVTILCGVLPPVSPEIDFAVDLKTYNEMLLEYMKDTEIHEITYNLCTDNKYLKHEFNYGDGAHLNIAGYKQMAEDIFGVFKNRYLENLLKQ